jgi:hypothetical protein
MSQRLAWSQADDFVGSFELPRSLRLRAPGPLCAI